MLALEAKDTDLESIKEEDWGIYSSEDSFDEFMGSRNMDEGY